MREKEVAKEGLSLDLETTAVMVVVKRDNSMAITEHRGSAMAVQTKFRERERERERLRKK